MSAPNPNKRGIHIFCTVCGKQKPPRGRSIPLLLYGYFCAPSLDPAEECPGYRQDPQPGDLWPGETSWDFGFPCSDNATEGVE